MKTINFWKSIIFKLPLKSLDSFNSIQIGRLIFYRYSKEETNPIQIEYNRIHQTYMTEKGFIKYHLSYFKQYLKFRLKKLSHWDSINEIDMEKEANIRKYDKASDFDIPEDASGLYGEFIDANIKNKA